MKIQIILSSLLFFTVQTNHLFSQTNKIMMVTKNSDYKCYTPSWNTKKNKLVYAAERGDKRDQIYLTMTARPISEGKSLFLSTKENPVFSLHALARITV